MITAAALHWGGAEQSDHVAKMQEGTKKLRLAAQEAIVEDVPPTEMYIFDPNADPALAAALPPPPAPEIDAPTDPSDPAQDPDKKTDDDKKKKSPEVLATKQPEPPKPAEPPKPPPPKVPDNPATPLVVMPDVPKPPEATPPPQPETDKKIAVIQNQATEEEKNDDAKYLAEKNHKVAPEDETHATITSTTDNDPNPTPGTSNGKPSDKVGNADKTVIAQDDDRPGAKVAPNVVPKESDKGPVKKTEDPAGTAKGDDKKPGQKAAASPTAAPVPTVPPVEQPSPGKGIKTPQPGSPEVLAGPNGTGTPVNPASSANAAPATSSTVAGVGDGKKVIPPQFLPKPAAGTGGKWVAGLDGAGAAGMGKLAINEKTFKAAVGMDELDRLKKVEAETQKTKHLGAWKSSSLEKWRSAIENYTPGVKPGNQTNLGTAAAPWATYLAQIHVRLHPIFADSFVDSLDDLPSGHPLNDKTLVTRMEIVMKADGTLDHLGIVKPSGVTAFDVAALDAVDRAAPFGKAPSAIVSPDGLVYLHWEFHRDEMRCSNLNAYPYVLKEGGTPVKPEPKDPPKPPVKPNPEDGKKYGSAPVDPKSKYAAR
ncbi:MAG: TonB family protein [Polyangiales bacterium]